jgi:hypothetical protein
VRPLHELLRILKLLVIVGLLAGLQIRFPQLWGLLGLERVEKFGERLSQKKSLAISIVGLSLFVIRGAGALLLGVPLPHYHDEFSYLLAADTFAHGRLTNPPHPMWVHFETFHVIWHPTYMSMYPPGQGLMLALGQVLGNPWIGQLLAAALMCAGICWMLQGWIPARWAFLAGVLAVARLGLLSYFTNGYWSSCLPEFGGALVLGSLPRIQHTARPRHAVILAIGLAILADTRPYEGFLVSAGVAVALFVWMLGKHRPPFRISLIRIILPIVLTLAPLAAWTGYYYDRVTGSPFHMAYDVNRSMYAMGRYFIWERPWPSKIYNHPRMQAVYQRELREAIAYRSLHGFVHSTGVKLHSFWEFYLVPPLPFFFIGLPCAVRDRRLRVPWMILAIFVAGLAIEVWFLPHYFAPTAALLYLFLMQCARHMQRFEWRGRRIGPALVRSIAVVYIATVAIRLVLAFTGIHPEREWQHGDMARASIVRELDATPGQHVIFVSYAEDFDLDREWVYNGANIDSQKIVWARDMGKEKNRDLVDYYRGRRFWEVEAGDSARLQPYPSRETSGPHRIE